MLRGLGIAQRFGQLLRLFVVGAFFSMFLLSSIGSDVTHMVLLSNDATEREHALSSVLLDRIVGLAVIIAVGLGAALLLPIVRNDRRVMTTLMLAVALFVGDLSGLGARPLLWLIRLVPSAIRSRLARIHILLPPAVYKRPKPHALVIIVRKLHCS